MIVITDWVADIPEPERHLAYVGENETVTREFLLTDPAYADWSFHLDMAFDLSSVTTVGEPHTLQQTEQTSTETVSQTGTAVSTTQTKDSYTRAETTVSCDYPTDVAYLEKSVTPEGIRLTWTVLAQHTRLPGTLRAVIRAQTGESLVKKTAIMLFEVGASVAATPAAALPEPEFVRMERRMSELVTAAQDASANADSWAYAAGISAADAHTAAEEAKAAQQAARSHAATAEDRAISAGGAAGTARGYADDAAKSAEQAITSADNAQTAAAEAKSAQQMARSHAATAEDRAISAGGAAGTARGYADDAAASAAAAAGYTSHPPVIGADGNWEQWNGAAYVSTGLPSRGDKGDPAMGDYALIEEIVLAEDADSIYRDTDPTGKPYNFKALRLVLNANGVAFGDQQAWMNAGVFYISLDGLTTFASSQMSVIELCENKGFYDFSQINGRNLPYVALAAESGWYAYHRTAVNSVQFSNITSFRLYNQTFKAGHIIKVYGVRA